MFLQKSKNERFLLVKNNKLCLRCLKPNHSVASCTRPIKCNMSNGSHHRLLHRDVSYMNKTGTSVSTTPQPSGSDNVSTASSTPKTTAMSTCALGSNSKTVFLATAVVNVRGANGTQLGRIFIDHGSQATLISKEFCDHAKLNLIKKEVGRYHG